MVRMVGLRASLLGLLLQMLPAVAFAANHVNACGRYSIWLPNNWTVTIDNDRLTGNSPDEEFWVIVAPLRDKDADLIDDDVTDFVEQEVGSVNFTSDRREKLKEFQVRTLEGTGDDAGRWVSFKAVALDPGGNEAVIELLVYATGSEMRRLATTIDRVSSSLTPTAATAGDATSRDALVNACGNYAMSIPADWKISFDNENLHAISRDGGIYVTASTLGQGARLVDSQEYVTNFVEGKLENVKFTSDRRERLGDFQARALEGTADEGDQYRFKALALDPGGNKALIEVLVYGERSEMERPANKILIDRILRSFKPI